MVAELTPIGDDLTEDQFLSGRLTLRQPTRGYRAAIDPVILAAAIPARVGETALDLGAGVGTASLCLLARQPGLTVAALELHPDLAALARENARLNGLADHFDVIEGDVLALPAGLAAGSYDHVLCNPPYLAKGQGRASAVGWRGLATEEGDAALEDWIAAALRMARPRGTVTLVHRADRVPRLLAALHQRAGEIVLAPLWPALGQSAKRVVVRARKDSKTPARMAPGLLLHGEDGRFTRAAEAILRDGQAFEL